MGYSAFKLVATGADGKSIRNTHNQDSHPFKAGQVVRHIIGGGWTAASAVDAVKAEAVGVIEEIMSTSEFVVVYQGEINTAGFASGYGVTGDQTTDDVWFLSAGASAGKLENVAPVGGGNVIKPMLIRQTGSLGFVTGYVGTVIGGANTVSMDEHHPIGSIIPYAGLTTDVPRQWNNCDGTPLIVAEYGDYYNRVGNRYGFYQTLKWADNASSIIEPYVDGTHNNSYVTIEQAEGGGVLKGRAISFSNETRVMVVDVENSVDGIPDDRRFDVSTGVVVYAWLSDGSPYLMGNGEQQTWAFGLPLSANLTHVKTPDMIGRVPVGGGQYLPGSVSRDFILGEQGGEDVHTLQDFEMVDHEHTSSVEEATATTLITLAGAHSHLSMGYGYGNHANLTKPGADIPGFGLPGNNPRRIENNGFGNCPNNSTYASRIHHEDHGHTPDPWASDTAVSVDVDVYTYSDTVDPHDHIATTTISGGVVTITGMETGGTSTPFNIMQPYLVTSYIIRTKSEASATIIDKINIPDNSLSDHNTPSPELGDILAYYHSGVAGTSGEYKNFKLFDGISADGTDEDFIRIQMEHKRVGIGTVTPGATLDVKGSIWIGDPVSDTTAIKLNGDSDINVVPDIRLTSHGLITANASLIFGIDDDDNSTDNYFSIQKNASVHQFQNANEIFYVNEDGQVGIGVDSAGIRPEDDNQNNQLFIKANGDSGVNHIKLRSSLSSGGYFTVRKTQTHGTIMHNSVGSGLYLNNRCAIGTDATPLYLPNADGTGNCALTVDGDLAVTGSITSGVVGTGQTWYDNTTLGRSFETVYTNSTGIPIQVNVTVYHSGDAVHDAKLQVDNSGAGSWVTVSMCQGRYSDDRPGPMSAIIPDGLSYRVTVQEHFTIINWAELR